MTHPTAPDALSAALHDVARLAALRATELLDTPPEAAFDRLTRLATRVIGAPVSLVSLVDAERQFFKSCTGLPEPWRSLRETPLSHSFCQHVVHRGTPLVIEDARRHPLVCDNLAIPDLGVVAYLGVPLALPGGQVLGSLCVIDHEPRRWTDDDLTTLGELAAAAITEIELRASLRATETARAEAALANRAKDDFLALVTHELRSPLTGISSNAQLLALGSCGPLTEAQARALERIRVSQGHLRELIDQLLDLKQTASGRMSFVLGRVAVTDALVDAAAHVEAQLAAHALRLVVEPVDPALAVAADPDKLRQILLNLLGNAAKFTASGGVITLAAAAEGDVVSLHVRDTGIGIPADALDAIFEPFFQIPGALPDARRASARGTGLGLAISRDLARGMGGDVTVESRVDVGTTFTIALPRA